MERCFTAKMKSIILEYEVIDTSQRHEVIEELRSFIFSPHHSSLSKLVEQISQQFYKAWASESYQRTRVYTAEQMEAIMNPIWRADLAKCTVLSCDCNSHVEGRISTQEASQYDTLRVIVMECIGALSNNMMESSVTAPILEMIDKITNFITDEQKLKWRSSIDAILCVLQDNGWDGNGFSRAPDRKRLYNQLIEVIAMQ